MLDLRNGYVEKTIFEKKGNQIHFFGYSYDACEETETPYRFVEYTFFYADIKDVAEEGFYLYENEHGAEFQQYSLDCNEEQLIDVYTHYYNGNAPDFVCVDDIDENLPDGCYIAYTKSDVVEVAL